MPGAPISQAPPGGWQKANATWFESYPKSEGEGKGFSGDKYAGKFADGSKLSPQQVKARDIVAFYNANFQQKCGDECPWWDKNVKGKKIWIRNPESGKTMLVEPLDTCADDDVKINPSENCTSNAHKQTGILIDLEKSGTAPRFYGGKVKDQAEIEWKWA